MAWDRNRHWPNDKTVGPSPSVEGLLTSIGSFLCRFAFGQRRLSCEDRSAFPCEHERQTEVDCSTFFNSSEPGEVVDITSGCFSIRHPAPLSPVKHGRPTDFNLKKCHRGENCEERDWSGRLIRMCALRGTLNPKIDGFQRIKTYHTDPNRAEKMPDLRED